MDVAAIIVTRGDQDLTPVVTSLPEEWEVVIWDNSQEKPDLSVYGRYAAIARTEAELIYVQDDDCIVSDPQAIVQQWFRVPDITSHHVVCNMPPEFRHSFYEEHALVGFGACFHRDAPNRAFVKAIDVIPGDQQTTEMFHRTCDIVFTALTPRVLVDVPHENLPWAFFQDRMYRQPELLAERVRMLDLVRELA